jgi:hypothetical protein
VEIAQVCAKPALTDVNVGWPLAAKAGPTPRPPPHSNQQAATNTPTPLVRPTKAKTPRPRATHNINLKPCAPLKNTADHLDL